MRNSDTKVDARIVEEAATWLEKIERTLSEREGREFCAWLKSSAHRETIVDRCKRWHGPEILAILAEVVPVETLRDRVERHYGRMVLGIFFTISGLGLMTVILAFSKVLPGSDKRGNPLRAEAVIQTAVGDRRSFDLPDGGSIMLNTASRAQLDYRPHARDATLIEGEAAFHVKQDEARPFLVFAGPRVFEVQSGAARFNVRKVSRERVELTVVEGQVKVNEGRSVVPWSPALIRARVTHGARTFGASEGGSLGADWQSAWSLSAGELARRTAWQSGQIMFENEPLEDALEELARYTPARFEFAEPQLRAVRVNAVFKTGDVEGLRQYLRERLHIDASSAQGLTIVLRRAAQPVAIGSPGASAFDCLANDSCRSLGRNTRVRFLHAITKTQ